MQQPQAMQQGVAHVSAPQQEAQTRAAQALALDKQVAETIRSNLTRMKPNLRAIHVDMLPSLPSDANISAEVSLLTTYPGC